MEIKINKKEATLCCGREKCPVIKKESEDIFSIKDDFGNSIRLERMHLNLITDAVRLLDE